jgi:hypothetical protein
LTGLTEIVALPRGARFHRADLHIHSFGGSHDVRDCTMTPENIVNTALAQGLGVIAVTDHNEINNVEVAMKAAESTELLVIPGAELSTPQGHLLAYLPSLDALQRFHARLDIVDRGKPESRCRNTIVDCLNIIRSLAGFGILAHVDAPSGFEIENPGGSPHKLDVICHPALLGIEVKSAASDISYGVGDPDSVRAQAGTLRIQRLSLGSKQFLARVLFSDSHALNALGRNAAGDKKVTRLKMDTPSFDALRIALEDSDARVRIEDLIPPSIPYILGVKFSGGFLDGQAIHFGPNLNCIIGGRGTGKSMTFEAIRCISGQASDNSVVDSEVWPAELTLYWEDGAGGQHSVQKLVGEELVNLDDADLGPVAFRIDCYGQGETAKLSQRAQSDPLALLEYLDRFIDLDEAAKAEDSARDRLLELQSKIEEAELKVAQIPHYERYLATTQQQLKALEKVNAAEVIQLQRKLATEREVRSRIVEEWREIQTIITGGRAKDKIEAIRNLADPADMSVGASELKAIIAGAAILESQVGTADAQLQKYASTFDVIVSEQVRQWRTKEAEAVRTIEAKRKELESHGVRLDMAFIQKLAKDEAGYKKSLEALRTWKPHLVKLHQQRAEALRQRWAARDRVASIRDAYARLASDTLKSTLSDLKVSLKFIRDGYASEAAEQIQQVMGWRTSQVPRATLLTQKLTLPALLRAIEKKNSGALTMLAFDDGTKPFNSQDAAEIIERLSEPKVKFALERCAVHDLPVSW